MSPVFDRVRAKPQSRKDLQCCLCGRTDEACLVSEVCRHNVCSLCCFDGLTTDSTCNICNLTTKYVPCLPFRCGFPGCSVSFDTEDQARSHGDTCTFRLVRCRQCTQYCLYSQQAQHCCDVASSHLAGHNIITKGVSTKSISEGTTTTIASPNNGSSFRDIPSNSPSSSSISATTSPINCSTIAWSDITYDTLRRIRKINEGAQGAIWECTINGFPGSFAVKYMMTKSDAEAKEIYSRAQRLTELSHEHLIRYYKTWINPEEKCVMVVMELYKEENLGYLIQSPRLKRVDEQMILSFGLQCGKALSYLHRRRLVHCDVKPQNILMFDKQTRLVLTDMDSMQTSPFSSEGHEAEYAWSAPEYVSGKVVTTSADIWSLGVVLFVMASLPEFPALRKGNEHILLNDSVYADEMVLHTCLQAELRPRRYTDEFILLLRDMIHHDPARRPDAFVFSDRVTELMTALLLKSASLNAK